MKASPTSGSLATPAPMNATAAWLAEEIAHHGLYEYLHRALLASSSFKREDPAEMLDHVHTALAAWVKRDAFAKYLAAGKAPRYRNLVAWAKQVSANTMRDRGTDALHRELRGARTEHERAEFVENENGMAWAASNPTVYAAVTLHDDNGEGESEYDLVDLDAVDATELLSHAEVVETVEECLARACPRSPEAGARLNTTFKRMSEEAPTARLAELLGTSELRAEKLTQRVRDRLRESEATVRAALSVLRVVADEPYSTRAEVAEALSDLSELPSVLKELVGRGLLTEHKGGTLRCTEQGYKRLSDTEGWGSRLLL
jgi:hypothetical protein